MKFIAKERNENFEYEFVEEIDFENLDNITHASGFFYDEENNICIVDCGCDNKWTLPGGGVEMGETFEEALYREVEEEADLDLEDLKRVGYYKVSKNGEAIEYHVKYVARIKRIKEQTINPDEGIISKRKFVSEDEFRECFKHRNDTDFLLEKFRSSLK